MILSNTKKSYYQKPTKYEKEQSLERKLNFYEHETPSKYQLSKSLKPGKPVKQGFGNSLYMKNVNWQQRTEKAKAYDSEDSNRDLYKSIGKKYTTQSNKPERILNFYKQKKLDYDAEFKEEVDYLYQNAKYKTQKKDLRQ